MRGGGVVMPCSHSALDRCRHSLNFVLVCVGTTYGLHAMLTGYRTGNGVIMPMKLPTVGCRGPRSRFVVGVLRPTVGRTVGITTPFLVHHPMNANARVDMRRERA